MIERYTFWDRICHWFTSLAYIYCLATGLAFYTPYLFWMAIALGGGPTSRFWHPWIGLCFFAAQLWMHKLWDKDVQMTAADREWLDKAKYYVRNEDDKVPPQGKYNAGQKMYYWAMFYGAFLLVFSGLFMWFPESIPFSWAWIRPVMVFIHEGAALITIGALIIHVYMSVFTVPGSVDAMVHGSVSKDWARTHHRLWFHQKTGE
jgi:formate dehydrogenase subunit gamma